MRKEVSVFALVLAAVLLAGYLFNLQSTGNVVFDQYTNESTCVAAGYTWENITEQQCANETVYTNQTYDCGPCLDPVNETNSTLCVTWTECVNQTSSIEEVCNDIVVSGQCTGEEIVTSISISQPTGEKDYLTGINLDYTTTGENLTCWYNVINDDDDIVVSDTTLENCAGTEFDVEDEMSYTVNVFANGSSGYATASTIFSVDLGGTTQETTDTNQNQEEDVLQLPDQPIVVPKTELSAAEIPAASSVPGNNIQTNLVVTNTGNTPLTACALQATGDVASWAVLSDTTYNLNEGQQMSIPFAVNVPEGVADGPYNIGINLNCYETATAKNLAINIESKKLNLTVVSADRTRLDRVRVLYELEELTGQDQDVQVRFAIVDTTGTEIANASQNRSLDANETNDFKINLDINETLEGNLTLTASYNSEVYSSSVQEPISLGAPIGGFAIFGDGFGAGSVAVIVLVVLILGVLFLLVRRMRKTRKTLKDIVS